MDWTTVVWRLLCLLAIMSGLAALTGLLPRVWLAIAAVPGLLVMLLLAVAWWHDSHTSSGVHVE